MSIFGVPKGDNTKRQILSSPIILGQVTLASVPTETTVGSNGAASALTANPVGYIHVTIGATEYQIPFYNKA